MKSGTSPESRCKLGVHASGYHELHLECALSVRWHLNGITLVQVAMEGGIGKPRRSCVIWVGRCPGESRLTMMRTTKARFHSAFQPSKTIEWE